MMLGQWLMSWSKSENIPRKPRQKAFDLSPVSLHKILRVCWPSEPRRSIGSGLSSSLWRFRRRCKTGQAVAGVWRSQNWKSQFGVDLSMFGDLCVCSSQSWHRIEKPTNGILLHLGSILSRPNRSLGIRRWDTGNCAIHIALRNSI